MQILLIDNFTSFLWLAATIFRFFKGNFPLFLISLNSYVIDIREFRGMLMISHKSPIVKRVNIHR